MRVLEDDLERDLRAIRPLPDPEFAAKLDERAAEGFPRPLDTRLARLRAWLATTPPRRLVAPLGAAATLIVVVAVAIGQSGEIGGSDGDEVLSAPGGGGAPPTSSEQAGGAPAVGDKAQRRLGLPAVAEGGGAELGVGVTRDRAANTLLFKADRAADVPFHQRKIAQSVDLALATSPEDFRDAADGVLRVVEQHNGFVVSSNVTSGDADAPQPPPIPIPLEDSTGQEAGFATFDLRIPANQLQATVGALSDLGHVVRRSDGQVDVTSRFLSAKKRIAALEETRANLLARLADAVTIAEQESIERRLEIVEAQLAEAEEQLGDVQRRIRLVPLTVTITADRSISADDGGDWGIGDAVDDAGRVLEVMAGIGLISLAILVPVALVGLVVWLVVSRVLARRRESALDA